MLFRGYKLNDRDIIRFWSHVQRAGPNECWPWTGCRVATGYGHFLIHARTTSGPHRIACWLVNGNPPTGKTHACHRCDNPPCCNGMHMFWGDDGDNIRDAVSKGRLRLQKYPEQQHGEKNPGAKLTTSQVLEIRAPELSGLSDHKIADMYGVSRSAIQLIRARKNWAHV